jgi:hypothetical protein
MQEDVEDRNELQKRDLERVEAAAAWGSSGRGIRIIHRGAVLD